MKTNNENVKDWTALYLPSYSGEDPSKSGFATQYEAEEYIFSRMCNQCKEERQRALLGVDEDSDNPSSTWPPCACEWLVVPTDEANEAESMEDIFTAAGMVKIWSKEQEG